MLVWGSETAAQHRSKRGKWHCDLFLKAGNVKIDFPPILSRVKVNFVHTQQGERGEENSFGICFDG